MAITKNNYDDKPYRVNGMNSKKGWMREEGEGSIWKQEGIKKIYIHDQP